MIDVESAPLERERRELSATEGALARRFTSGARKRLGQLALMVGLVIPARNVAIAAVLYGLPHPIWLREVLPLSVAGAALDFAMFLATRRRELRDSRVLRWGEVYFVVRTVVFVLLPTRLFTQLGFEPPAVTLADGFVLLFALFLPLHSRRAWKLASLAEGLLVVAVVLASAVALSPVVIGRLVVEGTATVFLLWCCTRVAPSVLSASTNGGAASSGYRLERLIRQERFGSLWLARHRLLARPAAVRTYSAAGWRRLSLPPPAESERFAQAVASLRSPHSVMLYDYGRTQDDSFYSVSEYITDGEALGAYVNRVGPLPLEEALTLALHVCDSLVEAHERRLAHCDVSPENVILCRMGRMERAAKLVKFDGANIEFFVSRGKPFSARERPWAAPELLRGEHCGRPSDIYQLGLLLELMLTNRQPTRDARGCAVFGDATRHPVAHIVDWCTTPEPRERPRARALREELDRNLYAHCGVLRRDRALNGISIRSSVELPSERVIRQPETPPTVPTISNEIREAARHRLSQVAFADVCVTMGLTVLFNASGSTNPVPAWLRETGFVMLMIFALDLCLWLVCRMRAFSTGFALEAGAFFFVLRAAILSMGMVRGHVQLGLDPPIATFAPLMVLLLPLFVPLRPSSLIVPTALTASFEPIALRFLVPPDFAPAWATAATLAIVVFLWSQVLAHVLYGFRMRASEREEFGAYRRGKLVGQGGYGQVWRAQHDALERDAALKILRVDKDTGPDEQDARLRRFMKEARITSQLTSPHTVKVYDYGINPTGVAYSVMELLDGEDLGSYVKRVGALPEEQVIAIALQICDSLGEAHECGLVHRDIKPGNVFLVGGVDGVQVKVLDFGIADFKERLSVSGSVTERQIGTPPFMPPEAFMGGRIDARSDIYELGCVLYFLLSGRQVFERQTVMATALAHVQEKPEPISSVSAHPVPAELEAVVLRCLEKSPAKRYQSIDELEDALRRVQDAYATEDAFGPTST